MSDRDPHAQAKELAGVLRGARSVLITTHAKPDGDAFGCVLALAWTLRGMGKKVRAIVVPPVPEPFGQIAGASLVERFVAGMTIEPVDVAVVLDTAAWTQVEPMRPVLEGMGDRLMVVDHHLSGDMPAKWRWVDAEAGACAELVAEIVAALAGEKVGIETAEGLYVGI
ncbi:MAG: DHH family phosphoesterase, partial [Verrucomicrobiae bacterium]|nr:DHH family phosphoesterase [Verrucomicrobiae bacterium]